MSGRRDAAVVVDGGEVCIDAGFDVEDVDAVAADDCGDDSVVVVAVVGDDDDDECERASDGRR